MLQVYTGNGKGKTTAAFGLAMRACGHGWRVFVIQFMKGDPSYGEVAAARQIEGLKVVQTGLPTFVEKNNPSPEDLAEARRGMALARQALDSRSCDMLILDELNVAVDYGLVPLEEVLALVDSCPAETELVVTGRYAAQALLDRAALVSEVREVKHPYQLGIVSRVGIDY